MVFRRRPQVIKMDIFNLNKLRNLYTVVEINLFLWLIVAGAVWKSSAESYAKYAVVAGLIIAALLQHFAYYNIYKKIREIKKTLDKSS